MLQACRENLCSSDEEAHVIAARLHRMLVKHGPVRCESLSVANAGEMVIFFSHGSRLAVIPDGIEDDEDVAALPSALAASCAGSLSLLLF